MNLLLLQKISKQLLRNLFPNRSHEVGVYFVGRKKITSLNEKFLGHKGSTDVITFDYGEEDLVAEIFICTDEAVTQARQFGTTPQVELIRYLVHGLLHLRGYDDRTPAKRARMKRAEDKWVRWIAGKYPIQKVWSRKRTG